MSDSSILDLIDSAVRDWETSPDAVRYNRPEPDETEGAGAIVGVGALFRVAAEFERETLLLRQEALHREVIAPFMPQATGLVAYLSASVEPFQVAMSNAQASLMTLFRALRLGSCPHGRAEPCFCHPKPNPAARDYRRRTKHRNRRQR